MKIDVCVAQIIKAPNFDNFTTSDVRSSYITLKNDPFLDPAVVRRRLYAELLKLVKKGWLRKRNSNKKGATRFIKTDLFDDNKLPAVSDEPLSPSIEVNKQKLLMTKLNHYKAELLINIGETEAYKDLYTELPELIDEIQPQYNEAMDNNSRILGKIRAIEGLIKQENIKIL